ncbi:MAG: PF20097 family protein [Candidatus Geothermarchaeales archaeon]
MSMMDEMSCPRCKGPMDDGYLGSESLIGGSKWFKRKSRLATGGDPIASPDGLGMVYLEGSRCQSCRLIVITYD